MGTTLCRISPYRIAEGPTNQLPIFEKNISGLLWAVKTGISRIRCPKPQCGSGLHQPPIRRGYVLASPLCVMRSWVSCGALEADWYAKKPLIPHIRFMSKRDGSSHRWKRWAFRTRYRPFPHSSRWEYRHYRLRGACVNGLGRAVPNLTRISHKGCGRKQNLTAPTPVFHRRARKAGASIQTSRKS